MKIFEIIKVGSSPPTSGSGYYQNPLRHQPTQDPVDKRKSEKDDEDQEEKKQKSKQDPGETRGKVIDIEV